MQNVMINTSIKTDLETAERALLSAVGSLTKIDQKLSGVGLDAAIMLRADIDAEVPKMFNLKESVAELHQMICLMKLGK